MPYFIQTASWGSIYSPSTFLNVVVCFLCTYLKVIAMNVSKNIWKSSPFIWLHNQTATPAPLPLNASISMTHCSSSPLEPWTTHSLPYGPCCAIWLFCWILSKFVTGSFSVSPLVVGHSLSLWSLAGTWEHFDNDSVWLGTSARRGTRVRK